MPSLPSEIPFRAEQLGHVRQTTAVESPSTSATPSETAAATKDSERPSRQHSIYRVGQSEIILPPTREAHEALRREERNRRRREKYRQKVVDRAKEKAPVAVASKKAPVDPDQEQALKEERLRKRRERRRLYQREYRAAAKSEGKRSEAIPRYPPLGSLVVTDERGKRRYVHNSEATTEQLQDRWAKYLLNKSENSRRQRQKLKPGDQEHGSGPSEPLRVRDPMETWADKAKAMIQRQSERKRAHSKRAHSKKGPPGRDRASEGARTEGPSSGEAPGPSTS